MARFRLPYATFTAWLLLLFNFEWLGQPIDIAPLVYMLAAIGGLAVLVGPQLARCGAAQLLLPALVVLLALKYGFGYPILGTALPITLTEYAVLAITLLLARWVAAGFEELQAAVFSSLSSDLRDRTQSFGSGQGELYREVRRARLFGRPLAFVAVAPAPGAVEAAKNRLTEEVMKQMVNKYVTARIADLLSRRLKDCDVITQRNCHFVAALPETDRDSARTISRQLQSEARKELGIELKFGLCTCPDEEATFIGLLERAEEDLWRSDDSISIDDHQSAAIEREDAPQPAMHGSSAVLEEHRPLLASSNVAN